VALGKRDGALHVRVQIMVRLLCEQGDTEAVVASLAEILLFEHHPQGRRYTQPIPPPVGVLSPALLREVCLAAAKAAEAYHLAGGVLVAKGFASTVELADAIVRRWKQEFRTISAGLDLEEGKGSEEINQRLTLVAQSVVLALFRQAGLSEEEQRGVLDSPAARLVVPFTGASLEGFCRGLADMMFRVFQQPNEEIHRQVHGGEP